MLLLCSFGTPTHICSPVKNVPVSHQKEQSGTKIVNPSQIAEDADLQWFSFEFGRSGFRGATVRRCRLANKIGELECTQMNGTSGGDQTDCAGSSSATAAAVQKAGAKPVAAPLLAPRNGHGDIADQFAHAGNPSS